MINYIDSDMNLESLVHKSRKRIITETKIWTKIDLSQLLQMRKRKIKIYYS